MREATEREAAISEILRAISSSPADVQPVLDAIAKHAVRYCAAEDALINLLNDDGTLLITRAFHGSLGPPAHPLPADRTTMTGRAVVDKRTIHVEDLQAETAEYPLGNRIAAELGFHTAVATPLLRDGVPFGAIMLRRVKVQPFSEQQLTLLRTFSAQAAIAIENVRLFNETKEALEQQTATAAILKTMSRSAFDLEPVLDTVVENTARLAGGDVAWLARTIGDEGYRVLSRFGPAFERPEITAVWSQLTTMRIPASGSLMGRLLRERRTIHIEDARADPELWGASGLIKVTGAQTVLAVPMLRESVLLGGVIVGRTAVRPFTEREIALVQTFADQAAIAIENVRLFNETREKSAQLEVANQELAAASRHKSEFLANMSHELRTPLNAVIGFSDVLEQGLFGDLNEKQADYTRDIASSGRHLLDLVNEILDLSKVEAGRMELDRSEFALADTIHAALAFVRERAAGHRIELRAQLPENLGTLVADERKIRQVLLNLLSNAVKFTPDGGHVAVRAQRGGDQIQISVQDTGIGIAPEDQPRVFEEFRQVGKTSDRSREGTGLGLTLAKRFIELHGGRIWIDSELGKGTTFTVALPLARTAIPN